MPPTPSLYESKQFTTGACFGYGWVPSPVLMGVLARFVSCSWPLLSMPVLAPKV